MKTNQDSIIATAIAIKQDGCRRGTVGNGRGQCVPARRERLRQVAGNAFHGGASMVKRGADLIQKTAATAIAAKALYNMSKGKEEKKDSFPKISCGKGWKKGMGKCVRNSTLRNPASGDEDANYEREYKEGKFESKGWTLEDFKKAAKEEEAWMKDMNENPPKLQGRHLAKLIGGAAATGLVGIGALHAVSKAGDAISRVSQQYRKHRDLQKAKKDLRESLKKKDSLYIATAIAVKQDRRSRG